MFASSITRQSRRPGAARQPKISSASFNENRMKTNLDRKTVTSSSTPSTGDSVRPDVHPSTAKRKEVPLSNSPTLSPTTSEPESAPMEASLEINRTESLVDMSHHPPSSSTSIDLDGVGPPGLPNPPGLAVPPGLPPRPTLPPGLSSPPGLPSQSRPLRSETESPQTPLLASQTSYQMSTAARALVDDVKARRGTSIPLSSTSPFPDFDRTLQTLSGDDGGFSFSLDLKLADQINDDEIEPSSSVPFHGSYMDAFPALRVASVPVHSSSQAHDSSHSIYDPSTPRRPVGHYLEKSTSRGSNYVGSFNPFSDSMIDGTESPAHSPVDEERKVSRFGFARGRQTSTAASSPLQSVSPLTSALEHHPFYQQTDDVPHIIQPWQRGHDVHPSLSHGLSPMATNVQPILMQGLSQLPLINNELSEAQLRNFILLSQERTNGSNDTRRMGGNSSSLFCFFGTQLLRRLIHTVSAV